MKRIAIWVSVGAALSFWPCPGRAAVPCGPFYQKAAADAEARQAEHDYLSHVARSVNAVAIVHDGLTVSTIGDLYSPNFESLMYDVTVECAMHPTWLPGDAAIGGFFRWRREHNLPLVRDGSSEQEAMTQSVAIIRRKH